MTNKKVNPVDILISPLGMENLLVIDQFNDCLLYTSPSPRD